MAVETQDQIQAERLDLEEYIQALTARNPYRHPAYEKTVKHAEDLAPHVFGDKPEMILERKRPNRHLQIKEYVIESYEPITHTEFGKVLGIINTIWAPGTFSINYPELPRGLNEENSPEVYFEEDFGEYGSLTNYIKDVDVQHTLGDPGGVTTIEWEIIPGEFPRPMPCPWQARQVLDYDPDTAGRIAILSDEKSWVFVGQTKRKEGNILKIYTKQEVITATQTGQKKDNQYDVEIKTHNLGVIPAYRQGGNMEVRAGFGYPRSYVAPVIAPWNKAVQLLADLDGSRVQSMFPKIVRIKMECTTCKGTGRTKDPILKEDNKCTRCHGTGDVLYGANDPYGEITVNPQRLENASVSDLMQYITPPVDIFERAHKDFEIEITRGFEALNLRRVNSDNPQESGVAKAIDRTEHENWLRELWRHFAGHMEFIYVTCTRIRYGGFVEGLPAFGDVSELLPMISPPVRFDYQSLGDITGQYKQAKEAGMPAAILKPMQKQIVVKQFGQNSMTTKRVIAEIDLDPFPGLTGDEMLTLNSFRPIPPIQAKIKADLSRLVQKAMETDSDFLDKLLFEQREILEELAKAELEEEEANRPAPILPPTPPLEE